MEGRLGSEPGTEVLLISGSLSRTDDAPWSFFLWVEDVDKFEETRAVWKRFGNEEFTWDDIFAHFTGVSIFSQVTTKHLRELIGTSSAQLCRPE